MASPCTAPARTALDLTPFVDVKLLRRIVAHIERAQRRDGLVAIRVAAERIGPKRRPAVAPLLGLIDRMLAGGGGLDLTPRYLAAFDAAQIPRPELEAPVTWGGRAFVLDAAFLPERVDVEFDDDWSHATAAGSHSDKERHRLARRAGWEVERVTPETDLETFVHHLGWLLEREAARAREQSSPADWTTVRRPSAERGTTSGAQVQAEAKPGSAPLLSHR